MRNPVSKYDFNKGGWHKDHKNDFDRQSLKKDLERELDLEDYTQEEDKPGDTNESKSLENFCTSCREIALKEYERVCGCICINSYN